MVDKVGAVVSDDITLNELKMAIYKRADELLVAKEGVVIEEIKTLHVDLKIPSAAAVTVSKVAEGAPADYRRIYWSDVRTSLDKYQGRILITHEALAEALEDQQVTFQIEAVAKGLARAKEEEIMSALESGASTTTVTATATWDDASANIGNDIADALSQIMDNTTLTWEEIRNIKVFVPAKAYPYLYEKIIGQTDTAIREFITRNYNLSFLPTRELSTDALVVVPDLTTAIHFVYNGNDIPSVEEGEVRGVGIEYLVTQYFETVVPDGNSEKIVKITNVIA